MQFLARRFFSSHSPNSLRTILEKEVIPARKESTLEVIQNSPPSENYMERRLSDR